MVMKFLHRTILFGNTTLSKNQNQNMHITWDTIEATILCILNKAKTSEQKKSECNESCRSSHKELRTVEMTEANLWVGLAWQEMAGGGPSAGAGGRRRLCLRRRLVGDDVEGRPSLGAPLGRYVASRGSDLGKGNEEREKTERRESTEIWLTFIQTFVLKLEKLSTQKL